MIIQSHEGVGPIRFGMSRGEVLDVFSIAPETFKRNPDDVWPCDYFPSLGCFVYYEDASGLVEAIELTNPANPTLGSMDLLHIGFTDLLKLIRNGDPDVSIDGDGFTSARLGIGGWAPSLKSSPNSQLEAVIVFAPDYYSR